MGFVALIGLIISRAGQRILQIPRDVAFQVDRIWEAPSVGANPIDYLKQTVHSSVHGRKPKGVAREKMDIPQGTLDLLISRSCGVSRCTAMESLNDCRRSP